MEAASHHEATFTEDDLHTELDKFLKTVCEREGGVCVRAVGGVRE